MRIRGKEIYISSEVWRWLYLLSKAKSDPENIRITTADEMADVILRQAIMEQHPQLIEHQNQIEKLEKSLIKSLQNEK